jgi:hypothetical protein
VPGGHGAARGAGGGRAHHRVRRCRAGLARGLAGHRQQPALAVEDRDQLTTEDRQPVAGLLEAHDVAPGRPGDRHRPEVAGSDAEGGADPVQVASGRCLGRQTGLLTRCPGAVGGEQADPAGTVADQPHSRIAGHGRRTSRGGPGRGAGRRRREHGGDGDHGQGGGRQPGRAGGAVRHAIP